MDESYFNLKHFIVGYGRYLQQTDFDQAANSLVIGYNVAEKIFVNPELAIGKTVRLKGGKPAIVIGVIEKQGQSMLDMWGYDDCIIMPYKFLKQIIRDEDAQPKIIVEGKEDVSIPALKDELDGAMRSIHKLSPSQEDDYSLNDIESFSKFMDSIFSNINIGGWAIAALSLIVGMFGVANIMFVTVKERTKIIGLKKAIGAKKSSILLEFLLEAVVLAKANHRYQVGRCQTTRQIRMNLSASTRIRQKTATASVDSQMTARILVAGKYRFPHYRWKNNRRQNN